MNEKPRPDEHASRASSPTQEQATRPPEDLGELVLERLRKDDGRALLAYWHKRATR